MTSTKWIAAAISSAIPILTCAAAHAGIYSEQVAGRAGPFVIHRIFDDGKVNRCAATLSPGPNMLRIAYSTTGMWAVSTPSVRKKPNAVLTFDLPGGARSFPSKTDGQRTWTGVDPEALKLLEQVTKEIHISVDDKLFTWKIGPTQMTAVMAAVENCVNQSM